MEEFKIRKLKQYNEDIIYLTERDMFPVIDKTIIKLDAVDDGECHDYKNKTGIHFMDEKTLIIGDKDNNVYLIFDKEDETITTKDITKHMHVIGNYHYDHESIIHKKHEVTPIPAHLRPIIINNVTNNFQSFNIYNNICFFEINYKQGGMILLKEMKRHPKWKKQYENDVEVRRVHICKSCNQRSFKGCCSEYSSKNRVMHKMVIGWSQK